MALHTIMMDFWTIISTKAFIITRYTTTNFGISEHLDDHLGMDIAQIIGIGDRDHIWEDLMNLEGLIDLEDSIEIMAMIEGQFIGIVQEDCPILCVMDKTEVLIHLHHQEVTWMFKGKADQVERLEMVAILEALA